MLGRGILRGLIETGRNFCGSYYDPARLTTVQYPEEKLPPQENARTLPFLVYDGQDPLVGLRCTACTICEQECPAHCIRIVKDTVKKPDYLGKMQFHPKVFDIDAMVCMSCGVCVEVCPFDSIKMDRVFELAQDRRALVLHKMNLAKSNQYYREIHPTEAAAVDAARDEEQRKARAKKAAAPAILTP
ncbi:MAG: 4Fe-4S dicluster domain-containing protein [Verrucomicrobiota bacterium]|jgi:NADH-quinone oxidoreductase subunit I